MQLFPLLNIAIRIGSMIRTVLRMCFWIHTLVQISPTTMMKMSGIIIGKMWSFIATIEMKSRILNLTHLSWSLKVFWCTCRSKLIITAHAQKTALQVTCLPKPTNATLTNWKIFVWNTRKVWSQGLWISTAWGINFLEMTEMLTQNYLHILFLSATKLDHSYPSAQFYISDFKCHRADRNEHGGGLMCYIRNDLAHRRRADLECLVTAPVESLIVEVIVRQEKWLFIGMYNPSYRYKNECCTNIEIVFDVCRNEKMSSLFFVGNLNINIMKPCVSACLSDTLDICGLTNMIRKPTCFKSPARTLLDVILTASPKRAALVLNVDTAISDFHNLIAFSTKLHVPRTTRDPLWYRSYKKFDEEYFKRDIATAPYHVGENFDDLDDKFWYSKSLIDDIINEHAPLKRKKPVARPVPFINASLRKACHKTFMARNKYFRQGRTQILWEKNRKSRNHASKVKKTPMKNNFESRCNKEKVTHSSTNFWDTVKPFLTDKIKNSNDFISLRSGD